MARLYTSSLELGDAVSSGLTLTGATITADRPRTQARSLKTTGVDQYGARAFTGVTARNYYARCYFNAEDLPSGGNRLGVIEWVSTGGNTVIVYVLATGAIGVQGTGFTTRTSATGLVVPDTWYRLEMRCLVNTAGTDEIEVRLNGTTVLTTEAANWSTTVLSAVRFGNDYDSPVAAWYDDMALNDDQGANQNSWPGDGRVYKLIPVSDPGTSNLNWTKPGGVTTNRHTSVDNVPPVYGADSTAGAQAERMVRNAFASGTGQNLTLVTGTYTAAGIAAGDSIALVHPVAITGASTATDITGNIGLGANPVEGALGFAAFDNGVASATATTWRRQEGAVSYSPSVTRGTGATIDVRRTSATAGTVMVNSVALLVEAVPPAGAALDPGVRADALGITDTLSFALGETVADPVAVTDVPLAVAVFERSIVSDQLGLTDAQALAPAVLVADAAGVTDATVRDVGKEVVLADPLALADVQAFVAVIQRDVADPIGLTDTPVLAAVTQRSLADPLGLTDAQAFVAVMQRSVADPIGLTDAQLLAAAVQRDVADLLGVTDLADPVKTTGAVAFVRTVDDLLGVADATALQWAFAAILDDPLGLTDARAFTSSVERTLADLISLTDARAFAAVKQRDLADLVGLADLVATFKSDVQPPIYMLTPGGWVRLLTPETTETPSGWVRIFTGT